jgi:hypothetical protein
MEAAQFILNATIAEQLQQSNRSRGSSSGHLRWVRYASSDGERLFDFVDRDSILFIVMGSAPTPIRPLSPQRCTAAEIANT